MPGRSSSAISQAVSLFVESFPFQLIPPLCVRPHIYPHRRKGSQEK